MSYVSREYSDPLVWANSIDWDDAEDGSEGGYTKHGAFIPPEAMKELVHLRKQHEELSRDRDEARAEAKEFQELSASLTNLMHKAHQDHCRCQQQRAKLHNAIQSAIDYANGREEEWGERAVGAFEFLHDALQENSDG